MIVLLTDFGLSGPYVGQMKAVLCREAPAVPVIDLFHDLPVFDIKAAAYLLAAYASEFPAGTIFVCVIDPGVGSHRRAAMVQIDGRWFVGPDNGLFNIAAARGEDVQWFDITWRPERLSASFHGRDVFAPVAARLARGERPAGEQRDLTQRLLPGWPDELWEVVYIDHYGNAMTGVRASKLSRQARILVHGRTLGWARTFSDQVPGQGFWYENANGLVEIAVNQGRADRQFDIGPGDVITRQD
ncbi:MAG: hypothetical protein A2V90_03865 [Gammaproteobacteria bacterium RBG_16_57_12]|nr:MAG: hypothetical protein A2V90_03865 [Gammaproteobacteria bacterium RBG_16_57_12]